MPASETVIKGLGQKGSRSLWPGRSHSYLKQRHRLFFAYFLLATQKKVRPRRQGAPGRAGRQIHFVTPDPGQRHSAHPGSSKIPNNQHRNTH
ncbi:MAG: hypothetical protein K0S16_1929 [Moraxellaceae bacterium]|nr:hypothetical protein [Moraxellaceae bacterium]